jgi:site-specific recombinase XerD
MKPTDFSVAIQKFFTAFLAQQRGCCENTIKSYRDTFKLFLEFMSKKYSVSPDKMTLSRFTSKEVVEFGNYLSKVRSNTDRTRNQRIASLRSFVKFLQYEYPDQMFQWQKIQNLPIRRHANKPVSYLSQDEIAMLLSKIETKNNMGIRDLALITLLYDSGARVQEIVNLSVRDVRIEQPSQVTLHGKGKKIRVVPLMSDTVKVLKSYMTRFGLMRPEQSDNPLFCSRRGERITRFGIAYLLEKYAIEAKLKMSSIPDKVSPHLLRHSKAMHLLEEGCSEFSIRDLLGHADLKTTNIYAKANQNMIRKAIEGASKKKSHSDNDFSWKRDKGILTWLSGLSNTTPLE